MATYAEILDLITEKLPSGSKIPAVDHRAVEIALLDYIQANIAQAGDIKRIKCDITYLNNNFEVDGLGKNLREGWAICNGNNGTDDLAGRVGVAYGLGWSVLGQTGGSKDAVLVSHSHTYNSINAIGKAVLGFDSVGDKEGASYFTATTSTVGVSGTDKNMQPYIIQLYIMKL